MGHQQCAGHACQGLNRAMLPVSQLYVIYRYAHCCVQCYVAGSLSVCWSCYMPFGYVTDCVSKSTHDSCIVGYIGDASLAQSRLTVVALDTQVGPAGSITLQRAPHARPASIAYYCAAATDSDPHPPSLVRQQCASATTMHKSTVANNKRTTTHQATRKMRGPCWLVATITYSISKQADRR